MNNFPWLLALLWLVCGILTYGLCLGYWQRTYALVAPDYRMVDVGVAVFFGLLGPAGLLFVVIMTSVHGGLRGFLWWPK